MPAWEVCTRFVLLAGRVLRVPADLLPGMLKFIVYWMADCAWGVTCTLSSLQSERVGRRSPHSECLTNEIDSISLYFKEIGANI